MTGEENPPMAERESVAGNPLLHSIDDACRRLSMGRSWLYAEIAAGNVKVAKLGRRTLIPERERRRTARQAVPTGGPIPEKRRVGKGVVSACMFRWAPVA